METKSQRLHDALAGRLPTWARCIFRDIIELAEDEIAKRYRRVVPVKLKFGEPCSTVEVNFGGYTVANTAPVLQPVNFQLGAPQTISFAFAAADANGVPVTGSSVTVDNPAVGQVVVLTTNPDGTPLTGTIGTVQDANGVPVPGVANFLFADTNGDVSLQVQATTTLPAPAAEVPVTLGPVTPPNPPAPALKKA